MYGAALSFLASTPQSFLWRKFFHFQKNTESRPFLCPHLCHCLVGMYFDTGPIIAFETLFLSDNTELLSLWTKSFGESMK